MDELIAFTMSLVLQILATLLLEFRIRPSFVDKSATVLKPLVSAAVAAVASSVAIVCTYSCSINNRYK